MHNFTSEHHPRSVNDQADVVMITARHHHLPSLNHLTNVVTFDIDAAPEAGNYNSPKTGQTDHKLLCPHLHEVIQAAVEEWGIYLQVMNWQHRRPLIEKFSICFADNYRQQSPAMTPAEYDSLKDLGLTCLLEHLDSETAVTNVHQARCYEASLHLRHRQKASAFWRSDRSRFMVVQ